MLQICVCKALLISSPCYIHVDEMLVLHIRIQPGTLIDWWLNDDGENLTCNTSSNTATPEFGAVLSKLGW